MPGWYNGAIMLVPTVIEPTSQGERSFDIYSRLDDVCPGDTVGADNNGGHSQENIAFKKKILGS